MFSSVMEPMLRPTIIVLLDETGDRVNRFLLNLTPSLDPVIVPTIAIVRYLGDQGATSERRSVLKSGDEEDDQVSGAETGDQGASADPTTPWTVLDSGSFDRLVVNAICDIQDVRVLERVQRAGIKTPDSLAQIVVVGRADAPILGEALIAARKALREAAHELGANISLDSPILCVLADYGTSSRDFTDHVRASRYDWVAQPEDISHLKAWYLEQASHDDGDAAAVVDPYEDLHRRQRRTDEQLERLASPGDPLREELPPATFQFLYSRVIQDRRATMSEELVEYIMTEAVFALAATGQTFSPSMVEVARSTPGVSATKDRLGCLGACLVRFPRGEAEDFCIMSLGADLLAYWGERERGGPADKQRRQAIEDAMRADAHSFVTDLLVPWIGGDLLSDWPGPGPDDWPDLDTFSEGTRKAGDGLGAIDTQLDRLISRREIDRLIASRDPDGEERRRPERYGALWKDVASSQWYEYDDVRRAQWNVAARAAYTGVSEELKHFLDRKVDNIWLDPQLGWEAASAYADTLSDDLFKTALEGFADDRIAAANAYETQLRRYEQMIREAYEDARSINPNEQDEDGQGDLGDTYEAQFRNDPDYFGNRPGGAYVRVDSYNPPNADPLMNGGPLPFVGASAASSEGGVTPGSVDDDTIPLNPDEPNSEVPDPDDPSAQPAAMLQDDTAEREPPTREEREDVVIKGMADLVVKRQLDRRMIWPAIGIALASAPVLTLMVLTQAEAHWLLSPGLVAASAAGVCATLAAMIAALWFWARSRADEALREHLDCLNLIGERRRADVEERLRVFVVNEAMNNARDMRDHLRNWPKRIERVAEDMRQEAQETSNALFNGPAGYHDILVAYGERLLPPEPALAPGGGWTRDGASSPAESPLRRIYQRFTDDRTRRPIEPWHVSLDGILSELRARFRAGQGGIIRMSDNDFRVMLRRFLRGRFRVYLRSEMGLLNQALDPDINPGAMALWREARAHADPPQGATGGDILFVTGQSKVLAASACLGNKSTIQRITTRDVTPHKEWLQITRLRRGGIPL